MSLPMPSTGLPNTDTAPALGGSRPEISASVVDLPQPVGPTTAQNSPGWTDMFRSRRAVYASPDGVRKRLKTPRNSIVAPSTGGLIRPPYAPPRRPYIVVATKALNGHKSEFWPF